MLIGLPPLALAANGCQASCHFKSEPAELGVKVPPSANRVQIRHTVGRGLVDGLHLGTFGEDGSITWSLLPDLELPPSVQVSSGPVTFSNVVTVLVRGESA